MKSHLILLTALIILGFSACEQCNTCTSSVDNEYRFQIGDTVTVADGIIEYNGMNYTKGQVFYIDTNSTLYENGLQFEGTGTAVITTDVCGSGHSYDAEIDAYKKADWSCG